MRPRIKTKAISRKNLFRKVSKEISSDIQEALAENQISRRKSRKS